MRTIAYLIELVSLNPERRESIENPETIMARFVESAWPDFQLASPAAASEAQKWLCMRLRQYIEGACNPWELCRMVSPIEQLFDFPEWLGALFNGCDWVEPSTNREDCPYLMEAATNLLTELEGKTTYA